MIHEKLNGKLQEWKTRCANFINIVTQLQSTKDSCLNFFETNNDTSSKDIILQMNFERIINQISELQNNISSIEAMNNTDEQLSQGFVNLIISEFVNYDMNRLIYINTQSANRCISFLESIQQGDQAFEPSDKQLLTTILKEHYNYLAIINAKSTGFEIFNKLKHIQNNIVMIGANGSGKSTFSRNLKSIINKQITVIPSQQLLYYEVPYTVNAVSQSIKNVQNYQHQDKLGHNSDIKTGTQEDFTNIILALKNESDQVTQEYYETDNKRPTKLSKIQDIFNIFNANKTIKFDGYSIKIHIPGLAPYDINSLSDGEKAIIYYAGHILFAEPNAYIIVDEPENHMHTALCDKLWNVLERERPDCSFVYLTHNLDFAVSRNNKTIIWNKSFTPPKTWDFEELPQDDDIPERLMTEIVGTRKNLLFCEGSNKSSIDFRLYNILFDNYTVIPMNTRDDVIKSVLAYNANPMFHFKAIGIVDRDNYRDLTTLAEKGIYVLNTNEVENILCDEDFIECAIQRFLPPNYSVDKFKEDFFKLFRDNIEKMAIEFVTDLINDKLRSTAIVERKDLSLIKTEFSDFSSIDLDSLYSQRKAFLQALYDNKDYESALSNCNLKKQLTCQLANKVINRFEDRALEMINQTPDLQELLIRKYLSHVPQTI